ncbi:MAG: flagellar basal body P-ring formation chaperone FlgA [Thermodesulfobacteriota bacterium]|nr:flagellar basal body P-ring formation chaperone FlgA [Thermodesulfobacteriota bacterium]
MKRAIYNIFLITGIFTVFFPPASECAVREKVRAGHKQDYQSIREDTFKNIFRAYLYQHIGKEKCDIIVSKFKVSGNRPIPSGKISVQVFKKNQQKLTGYVRLTALVKVNNVIENRVRLSGRADIFDYVVCARRNMKRGDIVAKDNIYLARKNISRLPKNIFSDVDRVIGLRMKNNIKGETCLKEWMLEKNPAVEKGDMVTIIAESDFIKIAAPGVVLAKGYLGEIVRVQNSMSKKNIYAKVINDSTVMVDF